MESNISFPTQVFEEWVLKNKPFHYKGWNGGYTRELMESFELIFQAGKNATRESINQSVDSESTDKD